MLFHFVSLFESSYPLDILEKMTDWLYIVSHFLNKIPTFTLMSVVLIVA